MWLLWVLVIARGIFSWDLLDLVPDQELNLDPLH